MLLLRLFRGLFKTLLDICDAAFCENSLQLLVINCFRKKKSIIDIWKGRKYVSIAYFYMLHVTAPYCG